MVYQTPKLTQGTDPEMGEKMLKDSLSKTAKLEGGTSEKQKCKDKGGSWDEKTQTCILINKTTAPPPAVTTPKVNPATGAVETFTNPKTGLASGVTMPNGSTYLGLSPAEVNKIAQGEAAKVARPENSAPVGTAQAEANRQQRLQQLIQMGEQGLLSPQELQAIQESPIDWSQALTAGTLGNTPSLLTRAAGGAAAGFMAAAPINAALASTGIGAIPAGVIATGAALFGAISAIWSGTEANIKKQQREEIGSATNVLTAAKSNINKLRMVVSQDPTKAEDALKLYYDQMGQVNRAYRKVQLETQGDLNSFMEDGTETLSSFQLFLQPGGLADIQRMRLEAAVMKGTPATPEQIMQIYSEDGNEIT